MRRHRNPRQRLSKHQIHHNPNAPTLVHSREACTMADLDAILWWRRVATVAGLIVLVDLVGRVLGSCGGAR